MAEHILQLHSEEIALISTDTNEKLALLLDEIGKLRFPVLYKGQIAIIFGFKAKTSEDTFIRAMESDTGSMTNIPDVKTYITIQIVKTGKTIENVSAEELTLYFPKLRKD